MKHLILNSRYKEPFEKSLTYWKGLPRIRRFFYVDAAGLFAVTIPIPLAFFIAVLASPAPSSTAWQTTVLGTLLLVLGGSFYFSVKVFQEFIKICEVADHYYQRVFQTSLIVQDNKLFMLICKNPQTHYRFRKYYGVVISRDGTLPIEEWNRIEYQIRDAKAW